MGKETDLITIGVPMISKPKLTDINLGSPSAIRKYKADTPIGEREYVNGAVEGTATVIPGTFSLSTPHDNERSQRKGSGDVLQAVRSNNFSNVVFIATVNVSGLTVIGEVAAEANDQTAVYYMTGIKRFPHILHKRARRGDGRRIAVRRRKRGA